MRLAVAVMTADGRISAEECEAIQRFDDLGLGPLCDVAEEEIERAAEGPVDIRATCAGLAAAGPRAASVILAALADVAASDRKISPNELEVLDEVASLLGLSRAEARDVVNLAAEAHHAVAVASPARDGESAAARRTAPGGAPDVVDEGKARDAAPLEKLEPDFENACRLLRVGPDVGAERLETAYLEMVDRYNPAKVVDLGGDFAVMAVRKLVDVTMAFEMIRARRQGNVLQKNLPDVSA